VSASTLNPYIPMTRLPYEVREELCFMIRDRKNWKQLNAWLKGHGYGPYKPQNYSSFKKSPRHYQAWLKQQRNLEERRTRAESIRREIEADGFDMVDRTMLDLVDSLSDPDLDPIKAAKVLASVKQAVTRSKSLELDKQRLELAQDAAELDRDKFRFQVANQFLSWFKDERAQKIATSGAERSIQVQQLIDLMADMEKD